MRIENELRTCVKNRLQNSSFGNGERHRQSVRGLDTSDSCSPSTVELSDRDEPSANSRLPNESTLQYVAGDATPPRASRRGYDRLHTSRRPAEQRWRGPRGSHRNHGRRSGRHCHPAPLWWQASDRNRGTKDQLLPTGERRPHLGSVSPSSRWFHTMCGSRGVHR